MNRRLGVMVAGLVVGAGFSLACSEQKSAEKEAVIADQGSGGTPTILLGEGGGVPVTGGRASRGGSGTTTGGSASDTGGTGSSSGGAQGVTGGSSATTGGSSTTGGTQSTTGGSATGGTATGGTATGGSATGGTTATNCANFSFFVTSLAAVLRLSGSANGFGGDLRYPDTSVDGLTGADNICAEIAATALPCAASKVWRAFLSTSTVDAIDRIGTGPWYDRNGTKVWNALSEMTADRPPTSYPYRDDLPNEDGTPNHDYDLDGSVSDDDNHDVLTGSGTDGRKIATEAAAARCNDWTSTASSTSTGGRLRGPWCGHAWPRQGSGTHWIHSIQEGGCGAGINLMDTGGATSATVGSGGGYGGIYCFALTP